MSTTNRFGLSRDIPASIARQIRQACGFGCVICGFAICDYEHIDPTFAEAREHDPERMALLCGKDHDLVTRGLLSKEAVAAARRSPAALLDGFSRGSFELSAPIIVRLGSTEFVETTTVITTREGEQWLSVAPPETGDGPYRLSATFHDLTGRMVFQIVHNELRCPANNWDCKNTGRTFTVRNAPGQIVLQLESQPRHELRLLRLEMLKGDLRVRITPSGRVEVQRGANEVIMEHNSVNRSRTAIVI